MARDGSQGVFLTTVENVANWSVTRSQWPVTMGLACCAIEMMSFGTPRFDAARFGMEVFRASPRQADLMIVSGRLSPKMGPAGRAGLGRGRLVVANPGGLYAITTSQPGHPGGRSAPNEFLYAICQHSSAAARGRGEGDSTARGAHPAVGGRPRRDR